MTSGDEEHDFRGGLTARGERSGRVGAPAAVHRPVAALRSIADHRYATVVVHEIPRPMVSAAHDLTAW